VLKDDSEYGVVSAGGIERRASSLGEIGCGETTADERGHGAKSFKASVLSLPSLQRMYAYDGFASTRSQPLQPDHPV